MPRQFSHSVAVTAALGAIALVGIATTKATALPVENSTSSPAPRQITIVRSLDAMELAQGYDSSASDPNTPSAIPNPSARGPIGSQGTSGNTLGTTGGMTGGMRTEDSLRGSRMHTTPMMNQRQSAPVERQSMQQQQRENSSWWKPWTWGSGMRSQQELQQEQQRLPSSRAAMRNPRYENETVVEQPWRAPDVPGGERGQTATGRESRVLGGSPSQSNPSMGSDYFGRQSPERPSSQQ